MASASVAVRAAALVASALVTLGGANLIADAFLAPSSHLSATSQLARAARRDERAHAMGLLAALTRLVTVTTRRK